MTLKIDISHPQLSEILNGPSFQKDNLEKYWKSFCSTIENPQYGFFFLKEAEDHLFQTKKVFEKFSSKKTFVHVGIGGSSLGPEMLYDALKTDLDRNFIFINNIDPDYLYNQLQNIQLSSSLFYIVSKSGGTAETMATFAIITNMLAENNIPQENFKDYFVFATDPHKSQLRDIGEKNNIEMLDVPQNIGGRFSALTPVGFLPALFAGIDVQELISGANQFTSQILQQKNLSDNILMRSGLFLASLKENFGVTQTIFMPYSSKLKSLSSWFVQLWAESLGKKNSKSHSKEVFQGLSPIPAYGATDQHSQVQLFMEGPRDKCLILIEIDQFEHDYALKTSFENPSLKNLAPHKLSDLLKAELKGTMKALENNQRPYIHLKVLRNDAQSLGQLILFFESLTVLMGEIFDINPFDQPGVEAGKIYAFEYLKKAKS